MKNTFGRLAVGALACAGLFIGVANEAGAKAAWQAHSGGRASDAGRGGITQTSDNGFITVGESQSFGGGDYDVLVTKVDICGYFQWSATYDIGGNDYGRKIKETPGGGYIITGETENTNNCCTTDDAFLLKITSDGTVEWANTYGGRGVDRGTDVELFYGGRSGYLVSGSTTSFGAGGSDGWLIATDPNGNMTWSRVYGGAGADVFNGLVQTANGDIVAVGSTTSYPQNDDPIIVRPRPDIFLVRTNDAGHVLASRHYGDVKSSDVGYSVIEYVTASSPVRGGDIVVAGYTTIAVGKGSAYLLRVKPDLSFMLDRIHGGGNTAGRDEFRDLMQAPWSEEIIAIGRTFEPKEGFGGYDVLAMRVDDSLNRLDARVYGGKYDDEGYGIGVDNLQGGFGWTGVTNSFTFGGEDQYSGLSFSWLDAYCQEKVPKLVMSSPGFKGLRAPTGEPLVWVQCGARTRALYNKGYELICSTCGLDGKQQEEEESGNELSFRSPLRAPGSAVVRTYARGTDEGAITR